jgi:hypothetical protein
VEGTTDVDGMLDRMSPKMFAEWCAKDEVEPIGYQSRILGLIAFQIAVYMAGDKADSVDAELYMPWTKYEPKEQKQMAGFQTIFNVLKG